MNGMAEVVQDVSVSRFMLGKVAISSVLQRVLQLSSAHRVQLDSAFTRLIVGIVTLEGIGRQLDPRIDIFREALPFLRRMDPQLREAARAAAAGFVGSAIAHQRQVAR